jgi:predicted YcjX-like family ATPase
METAMCTTTSGTLTLATMLTDPLILAVMRSDHVSEDDHAALLFRVKDRLAERAWQVEPTPAPKWVDA